MDPITLFGKILATLLSAYAWLIPFLVLMIFLKSPFVKGILGEWQVNLAARLFLEKDKYHLFKNITLPTEEGSTQIDHVIVSRYGVFVIETKNMKGWIFGDPNQKIWTQKIYRHTAKFQNPLHQNYKHSQTLLSALQLDPQTLFSIIVFVGDSTFKTPMPENVVYAGGYIRFIKKRNRLLLTEAEVKEISAKIESGRLKPSLKTTREHIRHVKALVEEKQHGHKENACPQCGRPMVLRTTKKGNNLGRQFLGCSAFPKCRAVKQIT